MERIVCSLKRLMTNVCKTTYWVWTPDWSEVNLVYISENGRNRRNTQLHMTAAAAILPLQTLWSRVHSYQEQDNVDESAKNSVERWCFHWLISVLRVSHTKWLRNKRPDAFFSHFLLISRLMITLFPLSLFWHTSEEIPSPPKAWSQRSS